MTLFAPAYQVVDMDDNVIYTIQVNERDNPV